MTTFQKVALLGKGTLGTLVLDELLKANYTVTIFTRSSTTSVPAGVSVKKVDYTSIENLTSALAGHDVVVSTLGPAAIPSQKPIIDAAIAAGVTRFIPADYGAMTSDPSGEAQKLVVHAAAAEIQTYLREKQGEIEHTIFAVGGFLEMLFSMPLAVDWEARKVTLYDGGEHGFSVSRISTVARAVVAALGNGIETMNRVVRVHDAVLTQKKVYEMARKWTPGEDWAETHVDAEKELVAIQQALQQMFKPELIPGLFIAAFFSGRFGAEYQEKGLDNELLGLGFMSEEDVEKYGLEIFSGSGLKYSV
ncbi:hypothetical protein BJY04DRAFT_54048 [Aspergillus karnatakaensis]|uniref:aromatic alcohol reductase n=1 Tax=Aspergillus karnatakaensis TaxID=1810916 RepID=UPI003CCCF32F